MSLTDKLYYLIAIVRSCTVCSSGPTIRRFEPKVDMYVPLVHAPNRNYTDETCLAIDEECVTINIIYIHTGETIFLIVHAFHRHIKA